MKDNLLRWIIGFSLVKFIIHLYSNNLYGLHRDEYLYIDEGNHLAWGFMEIPPFLPFLSWIGGLLGGHAWIYKLFPAIAGALIIYIIGKIIVELGGEKWSIIIASIALLISPALLRNSSLFQPVIFNQLAWLICAYLVIKIINEKKDKYYYFLGLTAGIAFLNKYSILFYIGALIIALLISTQRSILFKKPMAIAIAIATVIAAPNIYWQITHDLPVLQHMAELRETQLVHIQWSGFIKEQFLFHLGSGFVWMAGIYALFRYVAFYRYRFLATALLTTIIIIGSLSGKAYYTIGAFYILFPFGAIALERLLKPNWSRLLFLSAVVFIGSIFAPIGTPLIPINRFQKYSQFISESVGVDDFLYWEDGKKYSLPQDYADMHGWKELAQKVSKHFHNQSEALKERTLIFGGSYGHAGSLNFFKLKFDLPTTQSSSASYLWWADENINFEQVLYVIDERIDGPWSSFRTMTLLDSITNPYARDPGYIYLMTDTIKDPTISYKAYFEEERSMAN